jgi:hypothetical protein
VNSRWSNASRTVRLAVLAVVALSCSKERRQQAVERSPQGSAQQLGRELADIVDRVMAYRSSHRGTLPTSLRQAGIDSLTPIFSRSYTRRGDEPLITIRFRSTADHPVAACQGSNMVLEDAMMREGRFDVVCELTAGGSQTFTIEPPPKPKKDD